MKNYLLICNGLTKCLPSGIPWGNLLENIANQYGVSYNPDIAMPLEFERIVNEYLAKTPVNSISNDFIDAVKKLVN